MSNTIQVKECECKTKEEAFAKRCSRILASIDNEGTKVPSIRLYEICSGNCPPERPCPKGAGERLRGMQDGVTGIKPATESEYREAGITTLPNEGPGAELTNAIKEMGFTPKESGCLCTARAIQMNNWGVKGCRENFDMIVGWINEEKEQWGIVDLTYTFLMKSSIGTAAEILIHNIFDPIRGLVSVAISRAEKKEKAKKGKSNE